LSFIPISSSRFKAHLLEYSIYPIINLSFSRRNYFAYFYLARKEKNNFTSYFILVSTSSIANKVNFSTTLDYLVTTSSHILIKLDFANIIKIYQEKILLLETLTSSTSELPVYDKIFIKNYNSSKFILLSSFSKVMNSYLLSLVRTMNYEEYFSSLETIASRLFCIKFFKLNLILF